MDHGFRVSDFGRALRYRWVLSLHTFHRNRYIFRRRSERRLFIISPHRKPVTNMPSASKRRRLTVCIKSEMEVSRPCSGLLSAMWRTSISKISFRPSGPCSPMLLAKEVGNGVDNSKSVTRSICAWSRRVFAVSHSTSGFVEPGLSQTGVI